MTIGFKLEKIKVGNDVWGWRQLGHTVVSNQRPNSQIGRTEFYLACSCGGEHTLSRDPRIDDRREEYEAVRNHFDLVRNEHIEYVLALAEGTLEGILQF
jgi:hypothetical protein